MTARRICTLVAVTAVVAIGAPLASSAAATSGVPVPGAHCGDGLYGVRWEHGSAVLANAYGTSCARAEHVVRYALNHGLLAPSRTSGSFFALRRRHVLGFTFTADARDHTRFHARKGAARLAFNVCWLNVDC